MKSPSRSRSVDDPRAAGEFLDSVEELRGDRRIAARSDRDRPGVAGDDEVEAARADPGAAFRPGLGLDVREDAIECLRGAACAWAHGDPNNPPADEVWEQLWAIVEEAGIVGKRT